MIKNFKQFNESNAVEGLTEYELKIKNAYSDLEKGIGDGLIDLGKIGDVSDIDISNIQKTYPKSKVITKDGRYLLSVKENPVNESKIGNKIIEIYEDIVNFIGDDYLKKVDSLSIKHIDEAAEMSLSDDDYIFYSGAKDTIISMIEDEYLMSVDESTNESKEEDIFSENDDDYNEEDLERGIEIQKEHEPTYDRIKKFLDVTGELPSKKDVYKSIAKDHMDEPDGVGELYYDDELGLEEFEEELEEIWKKKKEDKDEN